MDSNNFSLEEYSENVLEDMEAREKEVHDLNELRL